MKQTNDHSNNDYSNKVLVPAQSRAQRRAARLKKLRKGLGTLAMAVIVIAGFYGYVIPMTRAGEPSALEGPYPVVSVTDGDTFACEIDGEKQKVRLIGVDCPESVHPDASKNSAAGEEASAYTKDLLTEKKVWLEFDTEEKDRYGRLLCYVYLDGEGKTMVQELLLSDGMAQVSTYPPNVKYEDRFLKLQRKARSEKKGFWAESAFE